MLANGLPDVLCYLEPCPDLSPFLHSIVYLFANHSRRHVEIIALCRLTSELLHLGNDLFWSFHMNVETYRVTPTMSINVRLLFVCQPTALQLMMQCQQRGPGWRVLSWFYLHTLTIRLFPSVCLPLCPFHFCQSAILYDLITFANERSFCIILRMFV